MIKAIATICILAAGTTAALANDTAQTSAQKAGIQRAAHNPYDANAKMMKKKHHHMGKAAMKEKPADGGMTNNWFGNDNKKADNDWFKNDNDAAPKKGKMKKSADTSNDWFANWNKNDANKGGMK